MKPITIRLEEEEVEQLDAEASDRGFANRTEYLRWMIRNRNGIDENTASRLNDHAERLEEIEDRLDELQSE